MFNIAWLFISIAFGILWGKQVKDKDNEIMRIQHELDRKTIEYDHLFGANAAKREEVEMLESIITDAGLDLDSLVTQKYRQKWKRETLA